MRSSRLILVLGLFLLSAVCGESKSGKKKKKKLTQGERIEYTLNEEITVATVTEEFNKEFGGFAAPMLCSACKWSARLWRDSLTARPEVNSSDHAESYYALKDAFSSACLGLPDPLIGVPGPTGPEFKAYDDVARVDKELAEKSKKNAESAGIMASRMCIAVLEDFRMDLLNEASRLTLHGLPMPKKWERLLCGRLAKLCKMQDVPDDDDDEEASQGQVTDSLEKGKEAEAKRQELRKKQTMNQLLAAAMSGRKEEVTRLVKDFKKKGVYIPDFVTQLIGDVGDDEDEYDPDLDEDKEEL